MAVGTGKPTRMKARYRVPLRSGGYREVSKPAFQRIEAKKKRISATQAAQAKAISRGATPEEAVAIVKEQQRVKALAAEQKAAGLTGKWVEGKGSVRIVPAILPPSRTQVIWQYTRTPVGAIGKVTDVPYYPKQTFQETSRDLAPTFEDKTAKKVLARQFQGTISADTRPLPKTIEKPLFDPSIEAARKDIFMAKVTGAGAIGTKKVYVEQPPSELKELQPPTTTQLLEQEKKEAVRSKKFLKLGAVGTALIVTGAAKETVRIIKDPVGFGAGVIKFHYELATKPFRTIKEIGGVAVKKPFQFVGETAVQLFTLRGLGKTGKGIGKELGLKAKVDVKPTDLMKRGVRDPYTFEPSRAGAEARTLGLSKTELIKFGAGERFLSERTAGAGTFDTSKQLVTQRRRIVGAKEKGVALKIKEIIVEEKKPATDAIVRFTTEEGGVGELRFPKEKAREISSLYKLQRKGKGVFYLTKQFGAGIVERSGARRFLMPSRNFEAVLEKFTKGKPKQKGFITLSRGLTFVSKKQAVSLVTTDVFTGKAKDVTTALKSQFQYKDLVDIKKSRSKFLVEQPKLFRRQTLFSRIVGESKKVHDVIYTRTKGVSFFGRGFRKGEKFKALDIGRITKEVPSLKVEVTRKKKGKPPRSLFRGGDPVLVDVDALKKYRKKTESIEKGMKDISKEFDILEKRRADEFSASQKMARLKFKEKAKPKTEFTPVIPNVPASIYAGKGLYERAGTFDISKTISRLDVKARAATRVKGGLDLRTKVDVRTKGKTRAGTIVTPIVDIDELTGTRTGVDVISRELTGTKTKTRTRQRQRQMFRGISSTVTVPIVPTIPTDPRIPRDVTPPPRTTKDIVGIVPRLPKYPKTKKLTKIIPDLETTFSPKYLASVEAVIYKKKGKRPSKRQIATGVILRPLAIKGL